jgi:predicted ATP-dependent Lon-type protease
MALDFVVIGIGVIHYLIGNYINKENAKILLAGYNTMSKVEREKFDIDEYLEFFKPFFKKLGIYSVIIYFVFSLLLDETTTLWVWTITVTIPVIYLAIYGNSNRFKKK